MYPWKNGKMLLWDFTCSDTLAPSYLDMSSKESGKVASGAKNKKIKKYEHLSESYHFIPISIETCGVWGSMGMSLVKEIGKNFVDQSGEKRSNAFLFQSIGISIQRGNALSILGTLKSDENVLHEVFLL